jgi:Bacterial regulatory proteins, tetR family
MARQVRSEATRRKILDAAVDAFNEVGYAAADRGAIIERTGMTKGALKAISERASIRKWSANPSSAQPSARGYCPSRLRAATTSSGD